MILGSLFSGGKDSTYAMHRAQDGGRHRVACLLSVPAASDESLLLHHPNIRWTRLQAESMGVPQIIVAPGSDSVHAEMDALRGAVGDAVDRFGIEGLVHGGICSAFQKERFESLCEDYGLAPLAPLWQADGKQYMRDLVGAGISFMIVSVSADGLDGSWLGRTITARDLPLLERLAGKFGFNENFEGGEAETFVVGCPMFSRPIRVYRAARHWDGYRGRFEICEAGLDHHA